MASDVVRDVVIGMSDGLTVPFALAAGLSGAVTSNQLIVTAGVAEIVAASIAMGLGGFLAAKSEADHYHSEHEREKKEVLEIPEEEKREIREILESYGLSESEATPVVEALSKRPKDWVDFMMRFELGLERINPKRMFTSAFTIAFSYALGGLVPLSPYLFLDTPAKGFQMSVYFTLFALFLFGFLKGKLMGMKPFQSAWQTTLIGGVAALAAYVIAKAI
ncbi:MAG: VIT1/CCC1 transporter family protein [Cyanobacteria bacterium]|nr:VIT1/CCC1 transporter family protein [Cyanobacteriota bacterium]